MDFVSLTLYEPTWTALGRNQSYLNIFRGFQFWLTSDYLISDYMFPTNSYLFIVKLLVQ